MAFVLDASVSAAWALADEVSPVAETAALRLKSEIALVPPLWWYETRNILIISERRQRMTPLDSRMFLDLLSGLPIQVDPAQDEEITLGFARQHRLSFYDAAYLAVAQRNGIPIATLDKALQSAARKASIPLLA